MKDTFKALIEGMRAGDLADLVLPLISVDEYESKIDKEQCIVIGFYVHDEDAAKDLNRFLQKSAISILDTEVSPAPDQHGYYIIFVEFLDNDRLENNVSNILSEIKNLVNITDWEMRIRHIKELVPFSEEKMKKCLDEIKQKKQKHKHETLEFFRPSTLSNILLEDEYLVLEGAGERHTFRILQFDRTKKVLRDINESPRFDVRSVAKANRIQRCLGESWEVTNFGNHMLLHNRIDPRAMLLEIL